MSLRDETRAFRAGFIVGHVLRVAIVVALLFGAAQVAQGSGRGGASPKVGVTLREGYGLSVTPRPSWVKVTYRGRTWWVSPADLGVRQPCIRTYVREVRLCLLDPIDAAWVK